MWTSDIACYVCDLKAPHDSSIWSHLCNSKGAQNFEGWGTFIEKQPHPNNAGRIPDLLWLCPAHSNIVRVDIDYLRRLRGLPVVERNHNGV